MKKKLISICTIVAILVFSLAIGFSCSNKVKLNGFEDATVTVEYGTTFRTNLIAVDENGNEYITSAIVKNSKNEQVELVHKSFIVTDKNGYSVEYKAVIEGKEYKKIDTLKVVASHAPIINIEGDETAFTVGKSYTVPIITAIDYFDGEVDVTVEIYKESEDADVKVDYDGNGTVTPTEAGSYYVKAMAKNSAGKESAKTLKFFVRNTAVGGEWDSFDDQGCVYYVEADSEVSDLAWYKDFKGRNGVLGVSLSANKSYSNAFRLLPKSDDKTQYEDKSFLVANIYVDGDEKSLLNYKLCDTSAADLPIYDIKYNAWNTFVFDSASVLKNWDSSFDSAPINNYGNIKGTIIKDCTIYFDSIYFANSVDLVGSVSENNNVVTIDYQAGGCELDYSVYYDGRMVETVGNTFDAKYAGVYTIYPHVKNSMDKVYTGEPITYESVTSDVFTFNEFDETIKLNATDYTLPVATADGYQINVSTMFTSLSGDREEKAFSVNRKGYFDFIFTGEKSGAKSLYERVRVRVGDYLEGEILNAKDADVTDRVGASFMGATVSAVDGKEIEDAYEGDKFIKIAYGLNKEIAKTGYVNFMPSTTTDEVNDLNYDIITLKLYVKALTKDGVSMPNMKIKFFGQEQNITPNAVNTIIVPMAAYVKNYYRLSSVATYADYVFTFTVSGFKGEETPDDKTDNLGFAETFSELALYMSSIVADVTPLPTGLAFLENANQTDIFNKDLNNSYAFHTSEQLSNSGLTGDYFGNAVSYTTSSNNGSFRVKNIVSRAQMNTLKDTYDYLTMWVAVDGGDNTSYMSLSNGVVKYAENVNQLSNGRHLFSGNNNNFKQWFKFKVPIEKFIELASGQDNIQLFSTYDEVSTVRTIYIGKIAFE